MGSYRRRAQGWLIAVVVGAAVIMTINLLLSLFDVPEYVIPPPRTIAYGLVEHRRLILRHLAPTAKEVSLGFLLGTLLALVFAIVIVHLKPARRAVMSTALIVRSVPIVVLTPILTLWMGVGLASKVAIVVLLTFFPTLVVATRGLASVDPVILDVMRTLGASPWQVLMKARIPSSTPYLFSALKVAAPTAVVGALVAEWLGSSQGIGHVMALATYEFRTDLLWATIIVAALLGELAFAAVALLQRLLAPWSRGESDL